MPERGRARKCAAADHPAGAQDDQAAARAFSSGVIGRFGNLDGTTGGESQEIEAVITAEELQAAQQLARKVPVPDHVTDFVLDLVRATRPNEADATPYVKEMLSWGAGPRAVQYLILGAKARAALLAVASSLSPTVEDTAPGICTISLTGADPQKTLSFAHAAVASLAAPARPARARARRGGCRRAGALRR